MTLPRTRRFACLLVPAVFGLAACGPAPQPVTDEAVQTQPVEDTQTQPSEAAQAQIESGTPPVDAPLTGDAASTMLAQIAGIAGAMHAAAKLCDPNVSDAQLNQAKDQLRQEFTGMGGDVGTFDGEFASAHEKTNAQFTQATPAQQKQMCDELEAMASQSTPTPAG
ncbi:MULTISPECIES: hypothetical protein [Luteimonas]|uniref:DUF4168 domain-containing protein n=1 Tax=Luteimonas terrae TaxID=1530191 RepID=A0ABU1XTJ8_9GAMM|nr:MULTISPECIES: hypothetical protein [Luteimonas]MDR6990183.1 hypothetical protein [Luteimonas sp. 3794]MDR7192087.1 hypothetical protein [Luteimonas terrae]